MAKHPMASGRYVVSLRRRDWTQVPLREKLRRDLSEVA